MRATTHCDSTRFAAAVRARHPLLVIIHVVISVLWLSLLATMVDRASGWFRRERVRRVVHRVTGGMLVGFGVAAVSEVAPRP